jgi:hypothetical protein
MIKTYIPKLTKTIKKKSLRKRVVFKFYILYGGMRSNQSLGKFRLMKRESVNRLSIVHHSENCRSHWQYTGTFAPNLFIRSLQKDLS